MQDLGALLLDAIENPHITSDSPPLNLTTNSPLLTRSLTDDSSQLTCIFECDMYYILYSYNKLEKRKCY